MNIAREIGDRDGEGSALNDLACCLLFLGNTDLAQVNIKNAVKIWEETGSPDLVEAYFVLSIIMMTFSQDQEAKTNLENSLLKADIFLGRANRVQTIDLKALALCGLAVCNHDIINADRAKAAFIQARAITKAKGIVNKVIKFFDLIADLDDKDLLFGLHDIAAGANV